MARPAGGTNAREASVPIDQALQLLATDAHKGLARDEALRRLRTQGYNEVPEEREHPVLAFARKFCGLSAWMLELIIALSFVLGKWFDLAVVSALLVVNAVIGYVQERRAAGAIQALRRRLQVTARALRDSTWGALAARELVPGDIVHVRLGDVVPADLRLLDGDLALDQSALTGESAEVAKSRGDVLPSGAIVRRGEGDAVVILTGPRTYFGRTTELVQIARPKLHIEEIVARVVRWLFAIVGLLLAAVVTLSLARGVPLVEFLPLVLVLLMSAVPVALPVMFTVATAVGSSELARRGVLVTRLSATEDAAAMDVLCVDKTGTVTLNQLAVTGVVALAGASEADVLLGGALASSEASRDPIDMAFRAAARERNLPAGGKVVSFTPFDPATRRTEAEVERDGIRMRVMKGAMRQVAEACGASSGEIQALEARVAESAARGYRSLAVAQAIGSDAPRVIGLVTLYDPPRADAAELIRELHDLGITVKMLTGDAIAVAREIGRMVGLPDIRGAASAAADGDAGDGLAEVYPEDKYRVIRELQAAGHVSGMTGDGVNDAPALRQAEIGIAVSGATDVAKAAASVVLTDPGLVNVVALVEQGRIVYQRVLTWIINKVSRTILKAGFVAAVFVVTGKFVISAFAMLLLVFMTDFAKLALATDNVRWSRRPESWNIGRHVAVSSILGVAMVAEAVLLLHLGRAYLHVAADDATLASWSFLTLLYFAVFSIVSARERRAFWASVPGRTLMAALGANALIGTAIAAIGIPGMAPLSSSQILAILAFALAACLGLNDAIKVVMFRRLGVGAGTAPQRA